MPATGEVPRRVTPGTGPLPALAWARTVLFGLFAAIAADVIWYAVAAVTRRQLFILALGVGFVVGLATSWGARRQARATTYLIAIAIAGLSIVVATYFIDRYFLIRDLHETGYKAPVDVWQGFDFASRLLLDKTFGGTRVFRGAARLAGDPLRLLLLALALAGSALGVFWPARRAE